MLHTNHVYQKRLNKIVVRNIINKIMWSLDEQFKLHAIYCSLISHLNSIVLVNLMRWACNFQT